MSGGRAARSYYIIILSYLTMYDHKFRRLNPIALFAKAFGLISCKAVGLRNTHRSYIPPQDSLGFACKGLWPYLM